MKETLLTKDAVSNPNLIVNGDFQVWQKGEVFSEAYNQYTADNWAIVNINSSDTTKVKVSHLELSSNFPQGNITNAMYIQNAKEGRTALRYIFNETCKGKNMLSFYVIGTGSKIQVAINSFSNIINIKTTNDWTRAEIPCEDVNYIWFILGEGETYITGVKLEAGIIATKFNSKSYVDTFIECVPHFYRHNSGVAPCSFYGNIAYVHIPLPAPMIKTPTVSFSDGVGFLSDGLIWTEFTNISVDSTGKNGILLKCECKNTLNESGIAGRLGGLGYIDLDCQIY